MLKIKRSHLIGGIVLEIEGPLAGNQELSILGTEVQDLTKTGVQKIVLDLTLCPLMDEHGLGEIIASYTYMRKLGGELALCGELHLYVSKKLKETKMDKVFTMYPTRSAAEKSLLAAIESSPGAA